MLLELRDLHVNYGKVEALHGINLTVNEGEIVTILGANGAGKSTTLNSICGLVKATKGEIFLDGKPIHSVPAHNIVKMGISQSPEGRRVFSTLTVEENMDLGAFTLKDNAKIERNREWIYDLFPRLLERRTQLAGTLSGGEQQMLAIGRALMSSPRLLLLDEPSLGLAPILVKSIFETIRKINKHGLTVILVEQNARAALKLADRGYVMEVGNIVLADDANVLLSNPDIQAAYLGGKGL
ncbi:ABC transporter ATP-binding protein [Halodesulfovibrio sp. MK-HDV]|jgi:branched-chain amino acid transport system ATP-binding protein|uniref:ABC transporter ATP-binding protein n=1 Tax=Halodesulfovibrio sp. MK-HDV TaxID=2599925 RepID=UPI001370907D|nr:ABC transporter ATP-binding protein [Halodesulfovibrio sp. MK-HDV]KAF1074305.1 High-affinity branched-chain amino acid transport ATP-binding protein LivF [Halodesulfovibrio sp. MK-HDV]